MSERQRLVAFAVGTTLALGALGVVIERWFGAVAGPEVELITQLKRAEPELGLQLASGATIRTTSAQYQRLSIEVDADGRHAWATATLNFTGRLESGTSVSSLGLEQIPFELNDRSWRPSAGFAPRVCAAVHALELRRRALEAGELVTDATAGVSRRTYRADAWYLRSERDRIEVAEDYRLTGDRADRPVDEKGTTRLTLRPARDGGVAFEPD